MTRGLTALLVLVGLFLLAGCADWDWKGTVETWLRQTCCNSDRCSGPPSCGRG